MTCSQCGAFVADGSRFCNMCGASAPAPLASAPPDVPERVIFTLRPSFLFVGVRYVVAAVVWLVATALVAAAASYFGLPTWIGAIVVVAVGGLVFINPLLAHLDRQRHLYTLTNYKLEIQYGLLSTTVRNIPLSKVQDITVTASLFDRLLGLGNVVVDNASENAGQIVIRNVPSARRYADLLLAEMRRWN